MNHGLGIIYATLSYVTPCSPFPVNAITASYWPAVKLFEADVAINANKKDDIKEILKLTQNRGVDVAIEAVGNSITINKAIKMVRPGGRVVLIGTGVKSQLKINTSEISSKELDFLVVWRYLRNFPDAIRLIANKQINTREIITHKFLLEKIEEAMILTEKKNKVVKIIFLMKKSF